MQDPKIPKARKPWYQRAKEMATIWKAFGTKPSPGSPSSSSTSTTSLWKSLSRTRDISSLSTNYCTTTTTTTQNKQQKLRKSTSLKVASSFTRVCLCAPISYYNEVFQADHHVLPPRRSNSYPRSSNKPLMTSNNNNNNQQERTPSGRMSVEGRKIFRGKSLTDDVQMRRFVVEEEAMMQQIRRRNEMEVIRRRSGMRRKKIGPSPLSRMVLAEEEE